MLKKLITLHAIAAATTTIIYTLMTHGDWAYIFAMMALYNWVLNNHLHAYDTRRLGVHIRDDGALQLGAGDGGNRAGYME